mmetsp:Transcript_19724/g.47630  ORF Transcript_19724/g.47630 Transcript_19724/m.47630 type:complete len:103 (-) Transcript_19724:1841-2149(-)
MTSSSSASASNNDEDLEALRQELQGQLTTTLHVLIGCVVFMVLFLIGVFIYVDCSHVTESAKAFLHEYNSQYIHDDHPHDEDNEDRQDETGGDDTKIKKKKV